MERKANKFLEIKLFMSEWCSTIAHAWNCFRFLLFATLIYPEREQIKTIIMNWRMDFRGIIFGILSRMSILLINGTCGSHCN